MKKIIGALSPKIEITNFIKTGLLILLVTFGIAYNGLNTKLQDRNTVLDCASVAFVNPAVIGPIGGGQTSAREYVPGTLRDIGGGNAPEAASRAFLKLDHRTAAVNTFCSPLQEVFSPNVDIGGGQTMPREFARSGMSVLPQHGPRKNSNEAAESDLSQSRWNDILIGGGQTATRDVAFNSSVKIPLQGPIGGTQNAPQPQRI